MTSYRVSPAADADLDHQADYLAREVSLETALKFYAGAASAIARNPGFGEGRISSRPRLRGLRTWRVEGFENHLIFYREADAEVEIVRVLHGSRNLRRLV